MGGLALGQLEEKRQQKARCEETKGKLQLQLSLIQILWEKKQNINTTNNTSVERQYLGSVNLFSLSKHITAIQLHEKRALFKKKDIFIHRKRYGTLNHLIKEFEQEITFPGFSNH